MVEFAATYRRLPSGPAAVLAIALITFREAIRDRILYLLLVFAIVLIAASRLVSLLTVGSEEKIIKDLGLSAISVFGVLTAVVIGVSLVYKEIEKRTLYTLLASPIRRWHFVTGKYAGTLAVLALNAALQTAALCAVLLLHGVAPWPLLPAVLLIFVQLALVTAFAVLFSSVTNPVLSAVGTLAIYVAGELSSSLELLKRRLPPGLGQRLCDVLYAVLPNLDRLDIKAEVVHGLPVAPAYTLLALGYGVFYATVVLVVACAVFERRDFV